MTAPHRPRLVPAGADLARLSTDEMRRLVHELEVHQIELELQNEELRHTQAALAESRDRLTELYDFAPVGYLTLDANGVVVEANLTVAALLGIERARMIGTPFTRYVERGDQDILYRHHCAVLGTLDPVSCELRLRRDNGRELPVRIDTLCHVAPATGVRTCRSAITDVTERNRAQANAQVLGERLSRLLALSPVVIYSAARTEPFDATYVSENVAAMTGFDAPVFIGTPGFWIGRVHPDDRGIVSTAAARLSTEGHMTVEYRFLHRDGHYRWTRDEARLAVGQGPDRDTIVGACTDITVLKAAQDATARAELLRRMIAVQEQERQRIGRELHDLIGQQLTSLRLELERVKSECGAPAAARRIDAATARMRQLDTEMDAVLRELRPSELDDLGLAAALGSHAQEWSRQFDIRAQVHAHGLEPGRLALEVELALYRIVQEALTNVARHAGATQVDILLEGQAGYISLIVEDNGIGFDSEAVDPSRGLGLRGMAERAAAIGATLEVESSPGAGTTVIVRLAQGGAAAEA